MNMKLALRFFSPALRLLGFIVMCAVLICALPVLAWEAWRR